MRGGEVTMAAAGQPPPVAPLRPEGIAVLSLAGHDIADYVWKPDLPLASSPRPYLHPVRTLAGTTVTDALPDSHPHQLGISVAAPDIGGRNFWGGRSFVAGHGPAWLDNHGIQHHRRWLRQTSTELIHTLQWADAHQTVLLQERRSITCQPVSATAWSLSIHTDLTNATSSPLPIRSPAAHGRAGAGYGGFFWRGPAITSTMDILSPQGNDIASVHGSTSRWLAISSPGAETGPWTMLFTPGSETSAHDRWFVRARDYLGVCLSVAWDQPLILAPGQSLTRNIIAIIIDGTVSALDAASLADAARSPS